MAITEITISVISVGVTLLKRSAAFNFERNLRLILAIRGSKNYQGYNRNKNSEL